MPLEGAVEPLQVIGPLLLLRLQAGLEEGLNLGAHQVVGGPVMQEQVVDDWVDELVDEGEQG